MKAHPAQGIAAFTLSLITASISCQAAAADPGVAATAEPIFLKYSSVNRAGLKKDYIGLVEEARFNPWILSGDGTRTVGPQKTAIHGGTPYLLYTLAGWTGFNYEMRPFAADQVTVRINYANRVLLESKEIGEVRAVNLGVCPADVTRPKPEDCLFSA